MLVLLFIIHSIEFEKSSETALGSGRVRSENCCAGRLQVRTYSQSPLGPEKELTAVTIQCTCNVTLRRVRATFVVVEKLRVLHIVSVCYVALVI